MTSVSADWENIPVSTIFYVIIRIFLTIIAKSYFMHIYNCKLR